MIVAILPDASRTESLLNSLAEAEYDLKDVSVVMGDLVLRNKIAKDAGPLMGVDSGGLPAALKKARLSEEAIRRCIDAVQNGKVLVVMKVDDKYAKPARESFLDRSAELIED